MNRDVSHSNVSNKIFWKYWTIRQCWRDRYLILSQEESALVKAAWDYFQSLFTSRVILILIVTHFLHHLLTKLYLNDNTGFSSDFTDTKPSLNYPVTIFNFHPFHVLTYPDTPQNLLGSLKNLNPLLNREMNRSYQPERLRQYNT